MAPTHRAGGVVHLLAAVAALAVMPCEAAARPVSVRLGLEGGAATLSPPEGARRWGPTVGVNAALEVGPLAALEGFADLNRLGRKGRRRDIWACGLGVLYRVDILAVAPTFGLGLGYVRVHSSTGTDDELVPLLLAGLDVVLEETYVAGVAFRYFPLLGSDLGEPAYSSFNLRVGLRLGG